VPRPARFALGRIGQGCEVGGAALLLRATDRRPATGIRVLAAMQKVLLRPSLAAAEGGSSSAPANNHKYFIVRNCTKIQ
jgi:hypothetical protein